MLNGKPWLGKLLGGVAGLALKGPIGAALGLVVGHYFDRSLQRAGFSGGFRQDVQQAFFNALFATMGHLAKADGRVSQAEVKMAEALMQRMDLANREKRAAIELFTAGKAADFDLDDVILPFARIAGMRNDLKRMFVEILLQSATADGHIKQPEYRILARICTLLHVHPYELEQMIGRYQNRASGRAGTHSEGTPGTSPMTSNPYAVLGIKRDASSSDIKRAYRKMISRYHPDKLVAKGLPEEMINLAKERAREINTAYDAIKEARGFK